MKLTFALPGLIWYHNIDYISKQIDAPKLNHIIRRAKRKITNISFSDFIYSTYISTVKTQSLALHIATNLGVNKDYPYFLLAEPTFLRSNKHQLLISESELLQLTNTEADTFIKSINNYLNLEAKLYLVTTNLWLIGLKIASDGNKFYPILDIIGEDIDEYLPKETNSIHLNKLLNEIQMLLFSLESNKNRQKNNLLPVNSLWLWDKTINRSLTDSYSHIFTTNALANFNNSKVNALPQDITQTLLDNSLIIIDKLYYPCCYQDSYNYLVCLKLLDETLGAIILSNLRKINQLEIIIPHKNMSTILSFKSSDKYKLWRNLQLTDLMKE